MPKKSILISLLVCFIGGAIYGTFTVESKKLISSESLVVPRDLQTYTKEAAMIAVGTIESVEKSSLPFESIANFQISKVLKGDPSTQTISIHFFSNVSNEEAHLLNKGENVLLFLARNEEGQAIVYAESNGKYLIDEKGITTSIGGFSMPLKDIETAIQEAL